MFNIGDFVICTDSSAYYITTPDVICKVVAFSYADTYELQMEVLCLNHDTVTKFTVDPTLFRLATDKDFDRLGVQNPSKPAEEEHIDVANILVKSATYERENKEFLTDYPTDYLHTDYYASLVQHIFDDYGVEGYTISGIKENVATWYRHKQDIIQHLRNHPNWNEEAKAVILKSTENRGVDKRAYRQAVSEMLDYISGKLALTNWMDTEYYKMIQELVALPPSVYINAETAQWLQGCGIKAHEGQKLSRVWKKIFTDVKLDSGESIDATKLTDAQGAEGRNYNSFDKIFAKLSDTINPLQVVKTSILSVNIADFLLMSNGNSWSSCHTIASNNHNYSGEYKAGTLSYANDYVSMIFYTISENYNGFSWYNEPKINRQVFAFQDGVLLQSRVYPQNEDSKMSEQFRPIVESIISTAYDLPNYWTVSRSAQELRKYISTYEDSLHYEDYFSFPNIILALNKDKECNLSKMTIGSQAYCVACGRVLTKPESLVCERCSGVCECANCGCILDLDYAYEIDGVYYCEDCTHTCHCCGENYSEWLYELHDEFGGIAEVCEDCLNGVYTCNRCGDRFVSEPNEVDGEYVCDNCFDRECGTCDECGTVHLYGNLTNLRGERVCDDCWDTLHDEDMEVKESD